MELRSFETASLFFGSRHVETGGEAARDNLRALFRTHRASS